MKTVNAEWNEFARKVLPVPCSDVQRQEMRRAFFAGATSMLTLISVLSDEAPNEDAGAANIELLSQELKRFSEDVKGGRA